MTFSDFPGRNGSTIDSGERPASDLTSAHDGAKELRPGLDAGSGPDHRLAKDCAFFQNRLGSDGGKIVDLDFRGNVRGRGDALERRIGVAGKTARRQGERVEIGIAFAEIAPLTLVNDDPADPASGTNRLEHGPYDGLDFPRL